MADELIDELLRNDPEEDWHIGIEFCDFQNQNQVDAVAQALSGFTAGAEFSFHFQDERADIDIPNNLNWDPLLRELETHAKLEAIDIFQVPTRQLLPLFRDQFFQALQRNPNVRKLILDDINFLSNDSTDGLVSFLDAAGSPSLTDLSFTACTADSSNAARNVATALQRNNRIQALGFEGGNNANLLGAIYQSLASPNNNASQLRNLSHCNFMLQGVRDQDHPSVAEALQQYLESPSVTIQCLNLHYFYYSSPQFFGSSLSSILRGVGRNTTINELSLENCYALARDRDNPAYTETVRQLSEIVRDCHNLSTLRVLECDFLQFPQFFNAVAEVLGRRDSSLRRLDFSVSVNYTPIAIPRTLLTAVSNNTQLEHLRIQWGEDNDPNIIQADHNRALVNALPSFKVQELTLIFSRTFQDERILEALKHNYTTQCIRCQTYFEEENWLSDADQARLECYMDRNKKLAAWTANPKLVPRNLWSYAMMLALKAGINPLFQSLVALSGQGIGLRQRGRKRKRPQYHDPSL